MNFSLPKIYPITDTKISGLSHVEQIRRLIAGGAEIIQLRDKRATPGEFYDAAVAALKIVRMNNARLIINDRVDVAKMIGADGVHLGQDDMPPEKARKVLGDHFIIGFSTHTVEQVREAITLPIDYVAFGPIFPTETKENPDAVTGLGVLRQAQSIVERKPLVAIGGINLANLMTVFDARADSASIIGAILSEPDAITERFLQFSEMVASV